VGAEAFTAADDERWLGHPGQMKALGDAAFCEGINRFVFHRYAMQPWLNRFPGNTMGPYGVHYERTQTWWEPSAAWNRYLTRCQDMLRHGHYVADICYLEWEDSPQGFTDHLRLGYPWDQAGTHAVKMMSVDEDGLITLPGGMRYRVLILPQSDRMTPELLHETERLVRDGATVMGPKPSRAWGMNRFVDIDAEVREVAERLWSTVEGTIGERTVGKGRMIWGRTPENVLAAMGIPADISADARLISIHRRTNEAEIYFVVNPTDRPIPATLQFRVRGCTPQFWRPVTGQIETAPMYSESNGTTIVPMTFEPHESVFVLFDSRTPPPKKRMLTVFRNGHRIASCGTPLFRFLVKRAEYGVPDDSQRTVDVREVVQQQLDAGVREIEVMGIAVKSDPAPGAIKTLVVEYAFDWDPNTYFILRAQDGQSILMNQEAVDIDIKSARYGLLDKPGQEQVIDVTEFLRDKVNRGENGIPVVQFARIRDPAIGETKHVEIFFTQDGNAKTIKLRDGETLIFEPTFQRRVIAKPMEGPEPVLEAWEGGNYEITLDDGRTITKDVPNLDSFDIDGQWQVTFPVGVPADGVRNKEFKKYTFEKLISWSDHDDEFIQYFSGTATYHKTFAISPETKRSDRRLYLDLGRVDVMAEVVLNGTDLGVLWTPNKRVDVTELLKEGDNTLHIKVTNLWINKMIGDDRFPEDTDRFEDGRPKEWPAWLLEGKSSPTGRETFSAWKLWNKDNKLLPSGLIGPVQIVPTALIFVK
jgi:hypothetical protein